MHRAPLTTRAPDRSAASALIVALTLALTAVPALAGTPPTIASFSPGSGPVGSTVTITGTGFTGATSVRFNGTWSAPNVASDTSVSATVPAGATTGQISVTTPGGTGQSATNFVVTGGSLPRFSDFNPKSGPVGTTVVIEGNNYNGATAVRFNGTSATFTVNSDTRITATVPPGATTGKISVTTPAGTAQTERNFTVSGTHHPQPVAEHRAGGDVRHDQRVRLHGCHGCAVQRHVRGLLVRERQPGGRGGSERGHHGEGHFDHARGNGHEPRELHRVRWRACAIDLAVPGSRGGPAKLFATGSVTANDGYTACERHVPVVIKRLSSGNVAMGHHTSTGQNGPSAPPCPTRAGTIAPKRSGSRS